MNLLKIFQFGLIKVTPGVFNLALVPFLIATLGATAYGQYSLWFGYAMLVGNVAAGVVTQPMYRHLSSHPEERANFNIFSLGASGAAGATCLTLMPILEAPFLLGVGFAIVSLGTVLATTVTVGFIIDRKIKRLAAFEAVRILVIIGVLGLPWLMDQQLSLSVAVLALAVSNLVAILLFIGRPHVVLPDWGWFQKSLSFGSKSAAWMLLAGVPIVGAKTILIADMDGDAFGSYAALADLTYRAFGMFNAVLMMWAFPVMSRQFDGGNIAAARRTLFQTFGLYTVGGAAVALGVIMAVRFELLSIDALPGVAVGAALVTAASFFWHAMSIAHKVLEMKLQTIRMVGLMAVGVLLFHVLVLLLGIVQGLPSFLMINLMLVVVAFLYSIICFISGINPRKSREIALNGAK